MVEGEPPDDPNLSGWKPGAVHLIQSVKSIKGAIHAVVIRAHPNDCKDEWASTRTLLASDFFRTWVPAPDGDAVRARERGAIQARIEGAESAIAIERRTREIPKIGVDHHEESKAIAHAQDMQKAIAERRERLLASAADIKAGIAALVPHQAEGLARIQAQHEVAMQEVAESEAQIRLLALFTGTGVTVETWSQGTPAPPSEPLHVYQRTRYIDQESMYEAMKGEGKGADIADLGDFMHRLARHPSMQRRICPAERCIVALQARHQDRQYDDLRTAIERDRANKETFLLVRNGERLHTVHWDAGTRERLLPRRDEWHRCFHKDESNGWWDEENDIVGPDDIRFVDTWRKAERTMRRYLETWVVIAGLHLGDDDLLGPITIPGAPPRTPANLLSHAVQTQLVVEIRDEEDALDTDLIPFGQLVQTQNARAHAGGRAVVVAHRIVREEERQRAWHAPRWWMDHDLPKLVATPKQELPIVCRIEAMGAGALGIRTLGIRIATDRGDRRPITLSAQSTDWLFLEGLDAQTLWRYARLRRREYAGVIPLAVPGALALEGEDEAITADARAAGLDPSAKHVRQAVQALRATGATGATEKPTRRRSSQVRALAAWIERGPHAITEACAHTGIAEPIAIHLKRNGSIQIWSGPPKIVAGLAWCETTHIQIGANGQILRAQREPGKAGITPGVVLHGMANESLGALGAWERHECWTDLQTILKAMTVVPEGIEALARKLRRNRADRQAMARGISSMGASNQRFVIAHGALWWPIAIVRDHIAKVGEPRLHTLMLRCDADQILAQLGGEAGLDAACKGLEETYAKPQTHIEKAKRDAEAPAHDVGAVVRIPMGAAKLDAQEIAQGNLPWYPDPKNRKEWPDHERKHTIRTKTHWWPSRESAQRESHDNARWEIVAEAPEGPWTSIPFSPPQPHHANTPTRRSPT